MALYSCQKSKLGGRYGGGVWYRLRPQINPHKAAQAGAVVQRFLAGQVSQVEPLLDEVNAQYGFQANGRAAIAGFRVVRGDLLAAQC